jgi:hypothetical protein
VGGMGGGWGGGSALRMWGQQGDDIGGICFRAGAAVAEGALQAALL